MKKKVQDNTTEKKKRQYDLALDIEKVLDLMEDKEMSQRDLSILTGWEEHTIGKLLKNPEKIRLNQAADIIHALDPKEAYPADYIIRVERKQ